MEISAPANGVSIDRENRSRSGRNLFRATLSAILGLLLAHGGMIQATERVLSTSEPTVKERGPHEDHVEYVATIQDQQGNIFERTNRYVTLATGLNRWDQARQAWVPASTRIEMVRGHGVAQGTQHRVILAPKTKSAGGLVDLETPRGERIVLQPAGLAVTDANNRSVFLAEIRETDGVLADSSTMVYADAFDLLAGSIVVKVSLDGVESDVILSERIDRRLLEQLGIEVETAKLEVWHEVLRKPRFAKKADLIRRRFGKSDQNDTVDFGGMSISTGTAFTTVDREKRNIGDSVVVAKEFVRVDGIDFLIESVPFLEAEAELQDLPEPVHAGWSKSGKAELAHLRKEIDYRRNQQERHRPLSLSSLQKNSQHQRQLALAGRKNLPNGYVIDYPITLTSQTNFTFRGDTTYYVTNRVLLFGTTRLEGGAVIKTVPYNASVQAAIRVMGDFECLTSPLNPAIFTARDDNTVGEAVADSTGVVGTTFWYSHYNLMFLGTNPVRVHDIQTRHGHVGVYFGTPGPHYLWNVQAFRCYRGIEANNATVYVRNALVHQSIYAISPVGLQPVSIHGEHLTLETSANLFGATGLYGRLYLTNSLISNVGNASGTNVFRERVAVTTNGAFKVAGRGRHYLADASPYRNAGTAGISPEMAKILRETTTQAPLILSGPIVTDTTLPRITAKDTDLPDLGFHYYPLDYLAGAVSIDGATLTLGSGVRVGAYGANAFTLRNEAALISAGEPLEMNALLPYNSVQSDTADWDGPLEGLIRLATPLNRVELRFTEAAALANSPERRFLVSGFTDSTNSTELDLSHSRLVNLVQAFRAMAPATIRLFNNILERCNLHFEQGAVRGRMFAPLTLSLHNNLFHQGMLAFVARAGSTPWIVQDNLFNSDSLAASGFNGAFAPDYNAFRIGLSIFGGANNRIGIDPAFEEGPLGPFYFADGSGMLNLINTGSRSAPDAGLVHFTTQSTPLSREGESRVDIGFHYPAVNSNGGLPDTDGDGLLDKDEDRNGDGRRDPGETAYLDRDTDMDGESDSDELRAGTDPADSRSVLPRSLASWRFNEDSLTGVEGQEPIWTTNIAFATGIEDRGADLSSTNGPVALKYRGLESDGRANVSLAQGSFRFRLKTWWVSNDPVLDIPGSTGVTYRGVGPQEWVTLIQTTNLAVRIDPNGTNILVTSRTAAGQTTTNLLGRILQDSDQTRTNRSASAFSFWYDVLVTYSSQETKVFWGGPAEQLTGTGIAPWDGPSSANQFVSIGSAADGTGKINGVIEDVVIYNVPGILQTNPWTFSSIALTNPLALNLVWPAKTNSLLNVKRRPAGSTNWTWLPGAIGTNLLDTNISVGQRYEYNLNAGFLANAGVREPFGNQMTAAVLGSPIESRGKVLLLVDESLQAALQPELNTFVTNLVGDGWSVLSTNVPRHVDNYSTTAAFAPNWFNITNRIAPAIRSQYALFSNQIKHILIIGHVTIPYTGEQADDGHSSASMPYGSHRGPWASDLYYSDVDGLWSDTRVITDSSFLENRNSPGDGKLDNDFIPANTNGVAEAEMSVARIDFARLPAFAESETQLLKRYLTKNARYRHKQLTFEPGTISAELLSGFINLLIPHQIAAETASKLGVLEASERGDVFVSPNSVVLAAQSGPGYVDRINDGRPNMQTTAQFASGATAPPCAFYLLRSSFMLDWNLENSFMKAILAPTNGGLAAGWFLSMGVWRLDPLAAGLELGSGWRETVNTQLKPFWGGQSARATEILGDSTLRYPILAPPSGLSAVRANNLVNITWTASPEPNCTYNIYRSTGGITSPFIRLNSVPLTGTSFSEPPVSRGAQLYMVRALKVTVTGSGSFTNLSQGVFIAQ